MIPTVARPAWMLDLDGVLVYEGAPVPGAEAFIARLRELETPFLVLTNNSLYTPAGLCAHLAAAGLHVPEEAAWTSALATARFLHTQRPGGSAFVLGEEGVVAALEDIGYRLTDVDPDYVVLGEMRSYSFESITTAIRLIAAGSRFVATNPDTAGASPDGIFPGTGSVAALVTAATGVRPYALGKPNPAMMRGALRALGTHSEVTVMVGDNMDTDIRAGHESGMRTVLVMTGVTRPEAIDRYPYRPSRIVHSLEELVPELGRDVDWTAGR